MGGRATENILELGGGAWLMELRRWSLKFQSGFKWICGGVEGGTFTG